MCWTKSRIWLTCFLLGFSAVASWGEDGQKSGEEAPHPLHVPEDVRPLAKSAADAFAQRDFEGAAEAYEQIAKRYPKSTYAWSNLGTVRSYQKRHDEAVEALKQALKISPKDAHSWAVLGMVYYQMRELEKAEAALKRSLELDPESSRAKQYLNFAREQKSWQERAIEEMKRQPSLPLLDAPSTNHFVY